MLEDENKLVRRAKDGEVQAFGLLYDHYLPKIYRFVLFKVSHREEAEDLTHQVFLKAWENIESFTFQGYSFGSWLYRIARNLTIDYYRSRKEELGLEGVILELPSDEPELETQTNVQLEWGKLLKAIKELGTIEQEVLIMHFVDDLPLKEIARVIGKSEGAVKLIQHRAIKKLKDKLVS